MRTSIKVNFIEKSKGIYCKMNATVGCQSKPIPPALDDDIIIEKKRHFNVDRDTVDNQSTHITPTSSVSKSQNT